MDNCGFHHGRHTEPILENMLEEVGCNLVFQPPYHPVHNTCEYCFRVLKGHLKKNTKLTEDHTQVAIYDGLKADFQSSHEAPRSSLRVLASN
jgi:transposase